MIHELETDIETISRAPLHVVQLKTFDLKPNVM
jgi:hypothetical protein